MNRMAHTPGPWRVVAFNHHHAIHAMSVVGKLCDVAQYGDVNTGPERREAAANAHLMAASPALLEALEELVAEANRLGPQLPYNAPTKDIAVAIEKARAAIRKARGSE